MPAKENVEHALVRFKNKKEKLQINGLTGLSFAQTALKWSQNRPIVILASNRTRALALRQDLFFLCDKETQEKIWLLAPNDRSPYHKTSPDPLVVMERAATLFKLANGHQFQILITSAPIFFKKHIPKEEWKRKAEIFAAGFDCDRNELCKRLLNSGYTQMKKVEDPGTFSLRGSIIDIFWRGYKHPIRLDFFGDEIESIRIFNPDNQRAMQEIEDIEIGPARELYLDQVTIPKGQETLAECAEKVNLSDEKRAEIQEDLRLGIPFFGIESLLPAFHTKLESTLELIESGQKNSDFSILIDDEDKIWQNLHQEWSYYEEHYLQVQAQKKICFAPNNYLLSINEAKESLKKQHIIYMGGLLEHERAEMLTINCKDTAQLRQQILQETLKEKHAAHDVLKPLAHRLKMARGERQLVFIPVSNKTGLERCQDLLRHHGVQIQRLNKMPNLLETGLFKKHFNSSVHAFTFIAEPSLPSQGGELPEEQLLIITEEEIFGKRAHAGGTRKQKKGFKTDISDLKEDDFVVHVEFGIGQYKGLTRLSLQGIEQDFIHLIFFGDDKLFIPVYRINLIQKYEHPGGGNVKLDKLGSTTWKSKKSKVKKAVLAMAQELLSLYAKRELAKRQPYQAPDEVYMQFESQFAFETTTDQQKAIDDVLSDMQQEKPMDRLICGDVGFGKTEVAMRAAMLAANSGKQVVILAPTTVLVQQHFITFTERFEGIPVKIESISRFKTPKESREIIKGCKEHKVDIVIGTHRLLSNDVDFADLGLIIIDEEQRFGVKAKERLKQLRGQVDVMTLSATPIPRTLQMGFFGIRDLSIIETAPVDRLSIRTEVIPFEEEILREGIIRELSRNGQVYFVHNRVKSIQARADYIKRICPEAKVGVGHGQMSEKELEKVMLAFIRKEINVFVCTAIIETGIDVQTANTMFIDHASDFGLSQLYQLRGRIGRSKERAFAYLIVPRAIELISVKAQKRLNLLKRFSDLGAGFQIAQHDLEIRGAGDLLGKGQHGHVSAVGYDLYAGLLKDAVEELKGQENNHVPDPDVKLPLSAMIPEHYIQDLADRLSIYQRFASAPDTEAVYQIMAEVNERFGDAPTEVSTLSEMMILKQSLRLLATRTLTLGSAVGEKTPPTENAIKPPRIVFTFSEQHSIAPEKLATLLASESKIYQITPKQQLLVCPTDQHWKLAAGQFLPLCRNLTKILIEKLL